tara:strand:- start:8329 stop:8487 length:159 start_codon:yes stop_codon:yes gene_type:complete
MFFGRKQKKCDWKIFDFQIFQFLGGSEKNVIEKSLIFKYFNFSERTEGIIAK